MTRRCYGIWEHLLDMRLRAGGKIVWLSDAQLTFYQLKYPKKVFEPIVGDKVMEIYGKYMEQTVD